MQSGSRIRRGLRSDTAGSRTDTPAVDRDLAEYRHWTRRLLMFDELMGQIAGAGPPGGAGTSTALAPATTSAKPPKAHEHPGSGQPARVNSSGRTSRPNQFISCGPAGMPPS